MPSKKGGKGKSTDGLPVRQVLPPRCVPLVPLPVFDEAALAKETWELKKKALFEDPDGLPPLPADIQPHVASWQRPTDIFQAAFEKRKQELQDAEEDVSTAQLAQPCIASPVVSCEKPIRGIGGGFEQVLLKTPPKAAQTDEASAADEQNADAASGDGVNGDVEDGPATRLPSTVALESVFWAVHNNEALVQDGNFLWECVLPQIKVGTAYSNPSGKYAVRLYEAGAWRQVIVDDRVPCDAEGRCLLPTSVRPGELWPWLISKALLKVHARSRQVAVRSDAEDGGSDGAAGTAPTITAGDAPRFIHWLTGVFVDDAPHLQHSSVKTVFWNSIAACVEVDEVGSKRKKKSKSKAPPKAQADAAAETGAAAEGAAAEDAAADGSAADPNAAGADAAVESKTGAEEQPAPTDSDATPSFVAPLRSIVVVSSRAGPKGVTVGNVCTIVRARKKGSRSKEILVREAYNPTPWQDSLRREFATLATDEDGTVLLADVVALLKSDRCQQLLQLAGVNPKVVQEYEDEVQQAAEALEAFEEAKKLAAATKGKGKAKGKGKGKAKGRPTSPKQSLEEPEEPRIAASNFEAALQVKESWISISDFHKYFQLDGIVYLTQRLESAHKYEAHWEWQNHVADSLPDSSDDENYAAAISTIPQQIVQGSLAAKHFWKDAPAILRCDGGASGSWFVIHLYADAITAASDESTDAEVAIVRTKFDADDKTATKKRAHKKPPAVAAVAATLSTAPGTLAGCLVQVPPGLHTYSIVANSASGFAAEVQAACPSQFGDAAVLGSDDGADGAKDNSEGGSAFKQYRSLRFAGNTPAGFYDVDKQKGALEGEPWDWSILSWCHVQAGANGIKLAPVLHFADASVAPFARLTRVDLATGISTELALVSTTPLPLPPNGSAGYSLIVSFHRSLAPVPLPSSPWTFTVLYESIEAAAPESGGETAAEDTSTAAASDEDGAAAGDEDGAAAAETQEIQPASVHEVKWNTIQETGAYKPNKYNIVFRKALTGVTLEANMAARIRLSDPNLYVNLEFVLETPPATVAGDDQEDGAESKAGDEATEQTRAPETQVIASASTKGSSTVFFSFPQNLPKPESGSRVYIQASLDLRYCDLPADLVSDGPFIDLTDFKPDHGLAGKSGKSAAPATTEEEESGDQGVTWDFAFVSDQPVNVTDDDSQAEKFGQLMASWEQQQPGRALLAMYSRASFLGKDDVIDPKKLPKNSSPVIYGKVHWDEIESYPDASATSRVISALNEPEDESKVIVRVPAPPSEVEAATNALAEQLSKLQADKENERAEEKSAFSSDIQTINAARDEASAAEKERWSSVWETRRALRLKLQAAAEAEAAKADAKAKVGKKKPGKGKKGKK